MTNYRAPKDLGIEGRKLWRSISAGLEWEPHELAILAHACRLQDDLFLVREALTGAPLVARGSMGQDVESPLLGSIRQTVALQHKLISSLKFEVETNVAAVDRSSINRRNALARWAH